MEILVFALVATRKRYIQHETFVPDLAKFQAFDLRPLRHPYRAEDSSRSRPSVRKSWVMA